MEELFSSYKEVIGKDIEKYKNHVYRVFNYCLYLSHNQEIEKFAVAAFFHDVGIWTHHTFDYLQPSINLARKYLVQIQKENWSEEISLMIDYHHKTSAYQGNFKTTVEIFRQADWIDVSLGFIHFGVASSFIRQAEKQFPNKGFHTFLMKQFSRNLLQHPLKPLPMFKK